MNKKLMNIASKILQLELQAQKSDNPEKELAEMDAITKTLTFNEMWELDEYIQGTLKKCSTES